MINLKEYNPNWPQIPDHLYRILLIGGSGSGETNSLYNLINYQPDIDKIYLFAKDPFEGKYKILINKRENAPFFINNPFLTLVSKIV